MAKTYNCTCFPAIKRFAKETPLELQWENQKNEDFPWRCVKIPEDNL